MSLRVGDTIGDYRVVELVGVGGMGQVFRAEHMITGRYEALKAVLKESADDPDIGARFLREIRLHANLNHHNIVAVYNAFWSGDDLVLVMEYVDGEPLDRLLKLGPVPLSRAVDITGQTLRALAYAHGRGVTHRDISPTNVLLTNRGVVKLMDFGLAIQPTDLRLTQSGVPVGSLAYMAPEQVRNGANATFRSDIYSVGIVLYQMLTGKRPFNSENGFEIMKAHIEKEPPSLRQWASHIPEAVEQVVMKALAKDPEARFGSAEEFREALQQAANPQPSAQQKSSQSSAAGQAGAMTLSPVMMALCAFMLVALTLVTSRMLLAPAPAVTAGGEEGDPVAGELEPNDPNKLRAGPRADQMVRSASPPGAARPARSTQRAPVVPPGPPRVSNQD